MARLVRPIAGLGCVVAIAVAGWIWLAGQDDAAGTHPRGPIGAKRPVVPLQPGRTETVTAKIVNADVLVSADVVPLETTIIGRVAPVPPAGLARDHGFRHRWPAVYASARFSGDAVLVGFDDTVNRYRISLDGADGPAFLVTRPGKAAVRIAGLGPGPHRVRLDKISESFSLGGNVLGLFVPAGGEALAPPGRKARQIEFIGDSDTVGYGNLSPSRDCAEEDVFFLTDTRESYGPRIARHFDADYQIIAISGIGLVRNSGGGDPGTTMIDLYKSVPSANASLRQSGEWSPQVVVLALGSNDFSMPIKPDEAWPDQQALRKAFETRYVRFIKTLRARYPQALFVLAGINNFGRDYMNAHRKILAELRSGGDRNVAMAGLPKMAQTGCHWHPSGRDHQMLAEGIVRLIDAQPDPWQD